MKHAKKTGLPPGALVFAGVKKVESPDVSVYYYNAEHLQISEGLPEREDRMDDTVVWIDIRGLHEIGLVQQVGEMYHIHPLALEDILDTQQRPKFEEYDDGFFLVLKSFVYDAENKKILPEQISIYCGDGFVLSFQEDESDVFAGVRTRVEQANGRIRARGADYLAYALADNLVDTYFHVLDQLGDEIEQLEDLIMDNPTPELKQLMHRLKECILDLRRGLSPAREAVMAFSRVDSEMIGDRTRYFIRDLYDHILRAIEINETNRESLTGLQDLFISEISFRMNKVMQTLTIVATIFIPLTFLAGIYGMNFDYIPELHYRYGYFVLLGIMVAIGLGLLYVFKRKRWF
ncbi:MAG: magnesium/cobalt transporter CorA [Saprospiraceae bacterium]|nr:magnesium/cobalt transporter CorA [Saprospiraceae bacterium]